MKLRNYQEVGIRGVRAAYLGGHTAPLLCLPTGGGKTICFSFICKSAASKGKRVLILAHRKELISQASNKLRDLGVRHGLIAPNYTPKPHELVQVASVQTLVKKLGNIQAPDLIVIDEGHHAPAGTWDTIRKAFPDAKILGVTATPIRSDNKGLATVYDYLVQPEVDGQAVTTKWLMREGFLSEAVCYCPDSGMDTSALKRGNSGDFTAGSAERAINKPRVTGDAVALYRKYAHAQPAIAFCASVKHAEVVAGEFRAAGYRVGLFTGNVGGERDAMIQGLASGKYHVLAACEMISEGTDIPVCSVAILMRPTSSLGLHLQQVGRVLRPVYAQGMPLDTAGQRLAAIAQGPKPRAIIIDMAGNVGRWEGAQFMENLGFPDTEWEWSLDTDKPVRRKAEAEPAEKTIQTLVCGSCAAFFVPAPKCPMCGTARPTKERKIIFTEGELREAQAVAKAEEETRKAAEVQANKNALAMAMRVESVACLKKVAEDAGKDQKWVFAMTKVVEGKRKRPLPLYKPQKEEEKLK